MLGLRGYDRLVGVAQSPVVAERWFVDGLVDLVTFELLEQIARTGSLSAAASAMEVSQQAASARLGRAERLLGQRLVRRGTNGSALTEQGGTVLEWATPVLEAARRAAVSLDALRHDEATPTVAASQTVAEVLLPGWLRELRRSHPEATVRLVSGNSGDVIDRVHSGTAQLGFIESPGSPAEAHRVPIVKDDLVVVVAPDHPWAPLASVDPHRLASTPLLLREPGSGTRSTFEAWLAEHGLEAGPPAAELSTTSAIRAAAAAGMAPAILSGRAVAEELAAGRLVEVAVDGPPPTRTLTAIWNTPELSSTARALVEIARGTADAGRPSAAAAPTPDGSPRQRPRRSGSRT